ncbi:hypothetical protein HK102_000243 [Quaeritorhiza haematococci]|nr:hypothetical protein HK102_000243 [Quaeritorhiza haematococci]
MDKLKVSVYPPLESSRSCLPYDENHVLVVIPSDVAPQTLSQLQLWTNCTLVDQPGNNQHGRRPCVVSTRKSSLNEWRGIPMDEVDPLEAAKLPGVAAVVATGTTRLFAATVVGGEEGSEGELTFRAVVEHEGKRDYIWLGEPGKNVKFEVKSSGSTKSPVDKQVRLADLLLLEQPDGSNPFIFHDLIRTLPKKAASPLLDFSGVVSWTASSKDTTAPGFHLPSSTTYLALERLNTWWIVPRVGDLRERLGVNNKDSVFVLWKKEYSSGRSLYVVMIPLPPSTFKFCNEGHGIVAVTGMGVEDGIENDASSHDSSKQEFYVGAGWIDEKETGNGRTVYDLITAGMDQMRWFLGYEEDRLPKQQSSVDGKVAQKKQKQFYDYLGWCTWNSFYTEVSASKILQELETFRKQGIQISTLLIDDGWQDTDERKRLRSFETNQQKFPGGLAPLVKEVKEKYGVRHVGVWHTLGGYWNGIAPDSPLGNKYKLSAFNFRRRDPHSVADGFLFHFVGESDVGPFYQEFHKKLVSEGIDFVKVDHQAFFDDIFASDSTSVWRAYQRALMEVDAKQQPIIWCMSHSPSVLSLYSSEIPSSHTWHIYANAMNSLYLGTASISPTRSPLPTVVPDWDMFQSQHHFSRFHAVARAISGSPLFVADDVGKHDASLLKLMAVEEVGPDGGVSWVSLRSPQPGWASPSCLLADPFKEKVLLKVFNTAARGMGSGGIPRNGVKGASPGKTQSVLPENLGNLAIFNCQEKANVLDSIGVSDVLGLGHQEQEGSFVARLFFAKRVVRLESIRSKILVNMGPGQAEMVAFSPVLVEEVGSGRVEFACVGLSDKLNGLQALKQTTLKKSTPSKLQIEAVLWAKGTVGFYLQTIHANGVKSGAGEPRISMMVNKKRWEDWEYDERERWLDVRLGEYVATGKDISVVVEVEL